MHDEPEVPEWVNSSRQTIVIETEPPPDPPRKVRSRQAAARLQRRRSIYIRRRLAALVLVAVAILAVWALWALAPSGCGSATPAESRTTPSTDAAEDIPLSGPAPTESTATIAPQTGSAAPPLQVPQTASGVLNAIDLPAIAPPPGQVSRTITVGLQIEDGSGVDPTEAANRVAQILGDARGWQGKATMLWQPRSAAEVRAGGPELMVVMASPSLTDRLCAPLRTRGEVSCYNDGKAVINARRWLQGAQSYGGDTAAYRTYLLNHEAGHALGLGHVGCPGAARPAPVMLQQTKGLEGCTKNPWPTVG